MLAGLPSRFPNGPGGSLGCGLGGAGGPFLASAKVRCLITLTALLVRPQHDEPQDAFSKANATLDTPDGSWRRIEIAKDVEAFVVPGDGIRKPSPLPRLQARDLAALPLDDSLHALDHRQGGCVIEGRIQNEHEFVSVH